MNTEQKKGTGGHPNNIFFSYNELPYFIIEKILNNIDDTKTYLAARATCKYWNDFLKNVKIFNRGVVVEKIFFSPKKTYSLIILVIIRKLVIAERKKEL